MKKFVSKLLLVAMLLLPVTLLVTPTGCTTAQNQNVVTIEYQTLSGVINTVEVARGIYDELYKAGKVSQDLDDKVAVIYKEYQRVGNLAIAAAKVHAAGVNNPTDVNLYVPQLQALVNQLLTLFNLAPGMPVQKPVSIAPGPGI